jgi:hypothetical protein
MSRNTNTNARVNVNNRVNVKSAPYCKVCHDAGKTKNEYTSHFVREFIGGPICCPTLLSLQCRFCSQKGHTVSFCPSLKEREARKAKEERSSLYEMNRQEMKRPEMNRLKNQWEVFDEEEEEEEDEEPVKEEVVRQPTYASILAKKQETRIAEVATEVAIMKPPPVFKRNIYKGSWASDTESDDEC